MTTTRTTIGANGQRMIISIGSDIDEACYNSRVNQFWTWERIAMYHGLGGPSSARTAAARHASRNGLAGAAGFVPVRRTRERTFGVEIEFISLDRQVACGAIAQALGIPHVHLTDYHGRTCQTCGRTVSGFREWKIERDGSVSDGRYGGEVVTPILKGTDGLASIQKVMHGLRQAGAEVDQKCGLHVHLSVQHMTDGQRADLVRSWYEHHDTFDRFVAKSRTIIGRGRPYEFCERADESEWEAAAENMERSGNFGYCNKYRSLNLAPFPKYGTVEIRLHQGTLNSRKVNNWVRLLHGFFDSIEAGIQLELSPGLAMLGSLADAQKISQETAAYLMARATQLA